MTFVALTIRNFEVKGQDASAKDQVAVPHFLSEPLITTIYTADPSAHVFNGKLYIYCSHDSDTNKSNGGGEHYDMKDYHVLSMNDINSPAKDNGPAITVSDIHWVGKQLWAPDAAYENGLYYLYFPAKDKNGVFRIGVATGRKPTGPFTAEENPMANTFSIDPCVFRDEDGRYYMYFGGLWGGQLQQWTGKTFDAKKDQKDVGADGASAPAPKIARLSGTMTALAEDPRDIVILDPEGRPLLNKDHDRRFFEGAWTFKKGKVYYFTYSTGDTHLLCYATAKNPYGPFTYQGVILKPVQGWTTHQSILMYQGRWYLFYHDTQLTGKNWLRNIKVTELHFRPDGSIITIDPFISK